MPSLFWLLQYFCVAFSFTAPLLEAVWITADRASFELQRILPRIKYQLTDWSYTHSDNVSFRYWKGLSSLNLDRYSRPLQLTLWVMAEKHTFEIAISHPTNVYSHYGPNNGVSHFSCRREWVLAILTLLSNGRAITPFALDFSYASPRRFWLPQGSNKPSDWVEFQ